MGIGSVIKRTVRRIDGQVRDQVDRAKDPNKGIWGDSPYARWAERLTGASTFKSAIYRHTGGKLNGNIETSNDPLNDAKVDARKGRPTKAYQDEFVNRYEDEAALKEKAAAADLERRSRGQIAVRIRRGMRDGQSTKGGTLQTGPGGLGSTGTWGTFAQLLGL